ncbi:VanZ family protein [Calidithermus roseus]|uniref:VanZ like family protein n=1 Tax=Calidithermus roseus TaxID=1644118 RepID=A0A399ET16_9DEIN|nr:VanZ family protein [Calidithermus roseus]RIH85742.1 VanZ like family protein [Calidithermus roseus]
MNRAYLALAGLQMALIFWFSAQPGDTVGIPAPWDKLVHAGVYALLGHFLAQGTQRPLFSWSLAVLYGLSDEIHQMFVPGRVFDLGDWLADAGGAALAILAWSALSRRAGRLQR